MTALSKRQPQITFSGRGFVRHAHGILPKPVFVEKNALELKGQYLGETAPKVKEAVAEAMGGCLFLDEMSARPAGPKAVAPPSTNQSPSIPAPECSRPLVFSSGLVRNRPMRELDLIVARVSRFWGARSVLFSF